MRGKRQFAANDTEPERHEVSFGSRRIAFALKRTARRTLAITVKPDVSVVVTAPRGVGIEAVKARVRKRAMWIRRQQDYFSSFQPKLPPRRYVSGETHRYLGRQYRLKVVEGPGEAAKLLGKFIEVETTRKGDSRRIRRLVQDWYDRRARDRFARSLAECLPRFHGRVGSPKVRIRRMPKRWGSWTPKGIIYLNPELVLAPSTCIDYVVTHELCHLVHASHGSKFYDLIQRVMPDWRERKERLEQIAAETSVCAARESIPQISESGVGSRAGAAGSL